MKAVTIAIIMFSACEAAPAIAIEYSYGFFAANS